MSEKQPIDSEAKARAHTATDALARVLMGAEASPETVRIAISDVKRDTSAQPRCEIDLATVADYAEAMRAGTTFPPVVVFEDGADHWLVDGFHRIQAAETAGLQEIAATVHPGTLRDAVLYSAGANAVHGLRRTSADKRRAVETLLKDPEWVKWSDREIARRCAVSVMTVSRAREVSLSQSDSERTYTTKHGTTATMDTSRIGKGAEPLQEDAGEDAISELRAQARAEEARRVETQAKAIRAERHAAKKQERVEHVKTMDWPDGQYRIFYADPPWQYSNSGNDTNYGHAERHFPTMSTPDICAMPVADLASDDAVLFLWSTSPMLEDAIKVIDAWGFQYKTSFVWDKESHNWGFYSSVQHELLLLAVRGSCQPDIDTRLPSVQRIKRTEKHSAKPAQFRKLIDTLYPHGPRIELFARTQERGWEVYGNEAV
jgi:N6-adenosine-specific RNA methylase IME4